VGHVASRHPRITKIEKNCNQNYFLGGSFHPILLFGLPCEHIGDSLRVLLSFDPRCSGRKHRSKSWFVALPYMWFSADFTSPVTAFSVPGPWNWDRSPHASHIQLRSGQFPPFTCTRSFHSGNMAGAMEFGASNQPHRLFVPQ
jgi:hypothetical protein